GGGAGARRFGGAAVGGGGRPPRPGGWPNTLGLTGPSSPPPAGGGGTGGGHALRIVQSFPLPNPPPPAGEGAHRVRGTVIRFQVVATFMKNALNVTDARMTVTYQPR